MIYFGYRTPGMKDLTIEQKLKLAKDLNMKAVELGVNEVKTEEDAKRWHELKDLYEIEIKTMGLGLELCKPEKEEENRKKLQDGIHKAHIIGIEALFSRTMDAAAGVPQKNTWQTCIEMTRECAEICANNGIKFAIEVDPPCFIDNLERVEYLIEKVNHPNLYVNYDPTNFYVRGSNPITVIDRLKHLFIGGHIKDAVYRSDYKGEVKIGEGEVDYGEIFRKLNAENIDLYMFIEHVKIAQEVIDGHSYITEVLKKL